jgi:hypothetical protein
MIFNFAAEPKTLYVKNWLLKMVINFVSITII